MLRRRVVIIAVLAAAVGVVPFAASSATRSGAGSSAGSATGVTAVGKQLYRQFCGQCHALSVALAAGFGSGNGLGQFGGPSFNNLRVPYNLSVVAVTEGFAGHEQVVARMTWQELDEVSAFIASATQHNSYLARVSDG
jgi:mono/diheme cytochrome c family protein